MKTHLAAKERKLVIKRCTTICDGLSACIGVLMEYCWVFSEMGKEALRVLEELETEFSGEIPILYLHL